MTKEKLLKKLKSKGNGLIVLGLVVLIGALALGAFGVIGIASKDTVEPEMYSDATKNGSYCAMDVYFMTDPFAEKDNDEMCFASDGENGWIGVMMNKSRYGSFTDIQDWTYSTEPIENHPGAVHIQGTLKSMDADMKNIALEVASEWNVPVTRWVYLKDGANPAVDTGIPKAIGAAVLIIYGVWTMIAAGKLKKSGKKTLDTIGGEDGIDAVIEEMNSPDSVKLAKKNDVMGNNHIIILKENAILPYSDVLWAYTRINTAGKRHTPVSQSIVLRTADKKRKLVMTTQLLNTDLSSFYNVLVSHNSDILIGDNSENRKQYKELLKK